ncbi:MAG: tRNA pseudouridine(55) synthase TruB [Bacilli bacterium]
MDGIYLIKKPTGITSRNLVDGLGKQLGTKKVGHTGTLDPFADGLMILTVGKATKAGLFLEALDKRYEATLKLGTKTDTGDLTGTVIATSPLIDLYDQYVNDTLESMLGPQFQMPPMYSAIKQDGVPLYQLAREGKIVTREPRPIHLYEMKLISLTKDTIRFSVRCSKGTYVRTLAEDIAAKFGMVGHLTSLTRIAIGQYKLAAAKTIDAITPQDRLTVYQALSFMDQVTIKEPSQIKAIMDGKPFTTTHPKDRLLLIDGQQQVLAIYDRSEGTTYKPVRGLF